MTYDELMRRSIARLIEEAGITQKTIGDALEMSASMISRWVNREPGVNPPSVIELERLHAFALRVKLVADEVETATRLRGFDDPPTPAPYEKPDPQPPNGTPTDVLKTKDPPGERRRRARGK